MRILVTGATGFLGSHTVRALIEDGHDVLGIAKHAEEAPYSLIAADLAVSDGAWQSSVKAFAPDAAIHLAWEGIPDYGDEMSARNRQASIALFSFLESIGVKRIVGVGSSWENIRDDAFTKAKNAIRSFGESQSEKGSITFVWARIFFAYGPGQRPEALIPSMVRSIQNGETVQLKTPHAHNDFIYVEDVARALALLLTGEAPHGTYEIGSGTATSVERLAQLVHGQCGMQFQLVPEKQKLDGANIANIQGVERIGWSPNVSLNEGVEKTVTYFKRSAQ